VKMRLIRCPETSVNNYHTTPCNYPEDHRFNQYGFFDMFIKVPNIEFHGNLSRGASLIHVDRRTMTNPIGVFRDYGNSPKKSFFLLE
jgi:hypothetical protein